MDQHGVVYTHPIGLWGPRGLHWGVLLVDVRTRDEFEQGHVAGALNIPLVELATRVDLIRSRLLELCALHLAAGVGDL